MSMRSPAMSRALFAHAANSGVLPVSVRASIGQPVEIRSATAFYVCIRNFNSWPTQSTFKAHYAQRKRTFSLIFVAAECEH